MPGTPPRFDASPYARQQLRPDAQEPRPLAARPTPRGEASYAAPNWAAPAYPPAAYAGIGTAATYAPARPATLAQAGMPSAQLQPPPWSAHRPGALPSYGATQVQIYGAHHLTAQLERVRSDINAHLKQRPVRNHAGRVVTMLGTVAAIGAGVATGVLVLGGAFASLTGIGIPVAAAAALGGVGVGFAGIGLATLAGAATRAIARRNVAKDPALADKVAALQQMQGELVAKKQLTPDEKRLLRNVNTVLGKVTGTRAHLRSQVKLAGKTTLVSTLSVGLLALMALAADGAANNGSFFWWGGSPLPLPTPSRGGRGLSPLADGAAPGSDDVARWSQTLHELGVHS